MKRGLVYLHLSRGGSEPRITSKNHSNGGPVFGPYLTIRFSDHQLIYMETDGGADVLRRSVDGIYYDGANYTEWSVHSAQGTGDASYDPAKIEPPPGSKPEPSSMVLEERFDQLVLLIESVVEDRLSILREKDPVEREVLLTSDIDDQIGHWESVKEEVMSLKEPTV